MTWRTALLVVLSACRPPLERSLQSAPDPGLAALVEQQRVVQERSRACEALRREAFTPEQVEAVGRRALATWLQRGQATARSTHADPRVSRVGAAVVKQVAGPPRDWRLLVVDGPEVDSFSVPPSTVLVTSGLLAAVHSDAALAGIVGHEVAHVAHEDALDVLRRENALRCSTRAASLAMAEAMAEETGRLGLDAGVAPDSVAFERTIDELVRALTSAGYGDKAQSGPEGEREADRRAAEWMHAAGFDVREYQAALSTLSGLSVPHPPAADRVAALEDVRRKLGPPPPRPRTKK